MIQANCFRYTDNEFKYQMLHWLASRAVSRISSFNQVDNAHNLEPLLDSQMLIEVQRSVQAKLHPCNPQHTTKLLLHIIPSTETSSILFRWN